MIDHSLIFIIFQKGREFEYEEESFGVGKHKYQNHNVTLRLDGESFNIIFQKGVHDLDYDEESIGDGRSLLHEFTCLLDGEFMLKCSLKWNVSSVSRTIPNAQYLD